jgi:hypothetical protein
MRPIITNPVQGFWQEYKMPMWTNTFHEKPLVGQQFGKSRAPVIAAITAIQSWKVTRRQSIPATNKESKRGCQKNIFQQFTRFI